MSLCIMVRHGERADNGSALDIKNIKLLHDPHLTRLGLEQADLTGIYLKQYLSEGKVTLVTSPYLRCIQTCEQINKYFNSDIFVSYGMSEYLNSKWFDRDILSELTPCTYFRVPYEEVILAYPETITQFNARFIENYKRCRNNFGGNVIIVTHGYGLNSINMLAKQEFSTSHIDYCAISILEDDTMIVSNSGTHIPKL